MPHPKKAAALFCYQRMDFYDFGIQAWLIGFAILAVWPMILWRQKRSIWHLLCFSVFWLYLLLLVKTTLFPIPVNEERWAPEGLQPWPYTQGSNQ